MSDTLKIQMTEEQARDNFRRIIPFDLIESHNEEIFFESFITNMKNAGYILKSSLQQKVEEAEMLWRNTSGGLLNNLHRKQHDVIQLLKQSHPEFRDK